MIDTTRRSALLFSTRENKRVCPLQHQPRNKRMDIPVTRAIVSRPDKSVTWTKVSLKEAKMWATPKTSSPSRTWGPRVTFSVVFLVAARLDYMMMMMIRWMDGWMHWMDE